MRTPEPATGKDVSLEIASGSGVYEWQAAEDRLVWSSGLMHLYGVTEAPRDEQAFSRLVHPDDRVRVEAETASFLSTDASTYSHTFRIVRPDGAVRLILDRGVIERDATGRVKLIRGMNVDLTDVRDSGLPTGPVDISASQRFSELEALYLEAPLGLALLDRELRFLRINPLLAEMNGYSVAEHLGRRAWDLLPDLRASAEPALRQVIETGTPLRNIAVRGETPARPGMQREWREHFYPLRGSDGRVRGIFIVCEELTDRLATERALAESEARLRGAAAAAKFGLHEFDPHRQTVLWSPEMHDILGTAGNDFPTTIAHALATVHPDDRERVHAEMRDIQRRAGPYELECRILRPDGTVRWILDRGEAIGPVDPETGLCVRVTGTVMDITARKEADAALALSERRFKLALAGSPITVFEHDAELRYRWLFNAKLGYSDTFAIGKTDDEIMDPVAAEMLLAFKRRVLERGQPERKEVIAAAPGQPIEHYDLHAHPHRDPAGRVIGLICVATDITEKKRTENALRESEERFRNMADNAPVMVWMTAPDGQCTYLNRAWYDFTGQKAEEALGFGWLDAVHPDDARDSERVFREASAQRRPFRLEYRLRRADGVWRWAIDSARPRLGADGEFLGFIGSVIDITERKTAEDALQAAHETLRHLVDHSPFGIYTVDADFRLVQVSEGARKVFANVHPLIGRDVAEVLRIVWPEPFASEAIARFRHTLATGEPHHAPSTVERRADIDATETYDWKIERVVMPDGRFGVVCNFYNLSERQAHEEKIQYLMRELSHRSKNMLALVEAVARQTASVGPEDFLERFSARVRALAAGQDLLMQTDWDGADLASLVESQLLHFKDLVGSRISLDGAPVHVSPQAAQNLGMALHELATNAAKYGALSNDAGHVAISWRTSEMDGVPVFSISWEEQDGPTVMPPTRRGFGARVAKAMLESAHSATVALDFAPSGVVWSLRCPLSEIGAAGPRAPAAGSSG